MRLCMVRSPTRLPGCSTSEHLSSRTLSSPPHLAFVVLPILRTRHPCNIFTIELPFAGSLIFSHKCAKMSLTIISVRTCLARGQNSPAHCNMEVAVGPRDWENPAVYHRNKCRSHAPLRAFASQDAALQYYAVGLPPRDAPNVQALNSNDWAFQLYDRPENVPKGVEDPLFDDGQWGKASSALEKHVMAVRNALAVSEFHFPCVSSR